jgi:putative ABC transport system ATP-binding protein
MINQSDKITTLIKATRLAKSVSGPSGTIHILQQVDLQLDAGEAVAILGASGSGKSTLLSLLAGLDSSTQGEVKLFGQSLQAINEDQRAALRAGRVGFVFQSFQLLPGMTALENVMLPLELAGHRQAQAEANSALKLVGLADRAAHYPNQLSGGEQQRVALARAFSNKPQLLFADEPTGSLDQTTGEKISDLLFELRVKTGAALLLVTHDQDLANRCDRRLHLHDGLLEKVT